VANTAQDATHRLIIHSLDDGSLSCACGHWTCVHTGRMNHQDAESEYQAHLLRTMTLYEAVRLGLIHATAELVGNQHGYLCPKCKSGEHIRIAATVWASLLPEGTDNSDSNTEWDETSTAQCTNCPCLWCGKVDDLLTVEVSE
jgi:hypothetical protein